MKITEQQTLIDYIEFMTNKNNEFNLNTYYNLAYYFNEKKMSKKALIVSFLKNVNMLKELDCFDCHVIDEIKTEFFQYLKTLN